MSQVTVGPIDNIPPAQVPAAEVPDVELYHARSWWTKYVFCQDAKVIAIQYSCTALDRDHRSEEHTSELQSLMRISYAVFCFKKKKTFPAMSNEIKTRISKEHTPEII